MKKSILTIIILFGMVDGLFAQCSGGGLFQYGMVSDEEYYGSGMNTDEFNRNVEDLPLLPGHGFNENQSAPLSGGIFLLVGFGAVYALRKHKERG